MAIYSGTLSAFDERNLGVDSDVLNRAQFRVQEGERSFGQVSLADDTDYYQLHLSGPGAYRLVISNDVRNNYSASNVWSDRDAVLFLTLAGPDGSDDFSFGLGLALAGGDSSISFVWTGAASVDSLYVKVLGFSVTEADYMLKLERMPLAAAGQLLTGTDGSDSLGGGSGNDALRGEGGDDYLLDSAGNDVLDGGLGRDTVNFEAASASIRVDLGLGVASSSDGSDTLISIEAVTGSVFDDSLIGSAGDDYLSGYAGNDSLIGAGGNDTLSGDAGDDEIDGGEGVDVAVFAAHSGDARYSYDAASGVLTVSNAEGTDRLRGIETLSFNDRTVSTRMFTDRTPPVVSTFNPGHGATAVAIDAPLVLTFDEPIQPGTGLIVLKTASGATVATYNVRNSANLKIDGQTLTIDPSDNLLGSTGYRVEIASGVVQDEVGNAYAGITSYSFSTGVAPLQVWVDDAVAIESAAALRFTVRISEAQTTAYQVTASVQGTSTARAGADFELRTQTVTIAAGQTQGVFVVPLLQDAIFEPTEVLYVKLSNPSAGIFGRASAQGQIVDDDSKLSGLPSDPLLGMQWYLYPQIGANVLPVWADYSGRGIKVGIFDQGIDALHGDLRGNVATALGRVAANPLLGGGAPQQADDNHGTAVAGVVAAERNGVGTVGAAYGATLVSFYSPLDESFTPASIANAYSYAKSVDVLNDSWGYAPQYYSSDPWAFYDDFASPAFAPAAAALKDLAATGRNGLGTVVVQSAGNSFDFGDDTNLHNFQNSRYIITVGATDFLGRSTRYSSPGASVLVSAPGGGGDDPLSDILTTDRTGQDGYDAGDTTSLRGTSFSSPLVAGVVALMLEANPLLGWRDVQRILAYSARKTAATNDDWRSNGATDWNGGGLHWDAVQHDLGFGLVDALAAVRLAQSWGTGVTTSAATSANVAEFAVTSSARQVIPDGMGSLTQTMQINSDIEIERVEVRLNVTHAYVGDLSVSLRSPSGTTSWLLSRPGVNDQSPYGASQADIHFTFSTVLSLGESARGEWALSLYDDAAGDEGLLTSWTLTVLGKAASDDDTYVYTDEFRVSAMESSPRNTLRDSAGIDTLNAAAVTSASRIDLRPGGSDSIIDGQRLTLFNTTTIENAWGGDAGDVISGNAVANLLYGMRGNDVLEGRGGDDRIDGGPGVDRAVFSGRRSDYVFNRASDGAMTLRDQRGAAGNDGSDQLLAIERLSFSDVSLAFDFTVAGQPGHAAQTAQIIRALFGASALAIPAYAGIGLSLLDGGMEVAALVQLAINTTVFTQLAGSNSNRDFVQLVYRNVVGTAPDAATLADYTALLDNGSYSQGSLGLAAVQYVLNVQSVELIGLAVSGLEYLPPAG